MSTNIITKAKRALLARILPIKETPSFTDSRLAECKTCLYNSMNFNNYSLSDLVKLYLNKFLNWMLLKEGVNKGVCLHPDCGCDLYLKTKEPEEECPVKKWSSIYIPNK
jgi:hypothetical protein